MRIIALDLPHFGFIVATRAMLGVGIGLLLAERLPTQQRRAAGAIMLALGALTTVPAVRTIRHSLHTDADRVDPSDLRSTTE